MTSEERQRVADAAFKLLVEDFESEVIENAGDDKIAERIVGAWAFLKKCRAEGSLDDLKTLFACFLGQMQRQQKTIVLPPKVCP